LSKKPIVNAQKNQNKGLFCHLRGCFEINGKNRRVFDKILRGVFFNFNQRFYVENYLFGAF